jgi:ComF family protein
LQKQPKNHGSGVFYQSYIDQRYSPYLVSCRVFKRAVTDLISLLFPNLCNGCGRPLFGGEDLICTACLFDLPYTDFHLFDDNRVAKQLWGRLPLNVAMAMLYFKKANRVQNLMHNLKYNNKTDLGVLLGKLLGDRLIEHEKYRSADLIMPVPLHKKKLRSRGYNQSYFIASGAAEILGITLSVTHLLRTEATESQTKKSRYTRYENMQSVFAIANAEDLTGKHILLIDDVLTTGATLEACGNELLKNGAAKISIATLAFTE